MNELGSSFLPTAHSYLVYNTHTLLKFRELNLALPNCTLPQ
jgi:hypothetical protein